MSLEASTFPKIVLQACRDATRCIVDGLIVSDPSSNEISSTTTANTTITRKGATKPPPSTPSTETGFPARKPASVSTTFLSSSITAGEEQFAVVADRFLQKHAMWILGDWRAGVPKGTHSIILSHTRKELFCFWAPCDSAGVDSVVSSSNNEFRTPSFLLLRIWFSRRDALEAHRALAYAAARVQQQQLRSLIAIPRSAVFACHGSIVSVTEVMPLMLDGGPKSDVVSVAEREWHDCLTEQILGYDHVRRSGPINKENEGDTDAQERQLTGGVLCPLSASEMGGRLLGSLNISIRDVLNFEKAQAAATSNTPQTPQGTAASHVPQIQQQHDGVFCRWLFVPSSPDVFVGLSPELQRSALHSRFLRRHHLMDSFGTVQCRIEELVDGLVSRTDEEAMISFPLGPEHYRARKSSLSAIFHRAGVNFRFVPEVRAALVQRFVQGGGVVSRGLQAALHLALDERLASRSVTCLLQNRLFDVAERTARLPTTEKVLRERRGVSNLLAKLWRDASSSFLLNGIKDHYGADACDRCLLVKFPLHKALTTPGSTGLAAVLGAATLSLGIPCTVDVYTGDKTIDAVAVSFETEGTLPSFFSSCVVRLTSLREGDMFDTLMISPLQAANEQQQQSVLANILQRLLLPSSETDAQRALNVLLPMERSSKQTDQLGVAVYVFMLAHRQLRQQVYATPPSWEEVVLSGSSLESTEVQKSLSTIVASALRTLTRYVLAEQSPSSPFQTQRCVAYQSIRMIVKWLHRKTTLLMQGGDAPPTNHVNAGKKDNQCHVELLSAITAACGVCAAWRLGHEYVLQHQQSLEQRGDNNMRQLRLASALFLTYEHAEVDQEIQQKPSAIVGPSTWSLFVLRSVLLGKSHGPVLQQDDVFLGALCLVAAHIAHAAHVEQREDLSALGLLVALPAATLPLATIETIESLLQLRSVGGIGVPYTLSFLMLQLMVELEQLDNVIVPTVLGTALARWMFAGVEPLSSAIVEMMNDATSQLFPPPSSMNLISSLSPRNRARKALESYCQGKAFQSQRVAMSRAVLESALASPTRHLTLAIAGDAPTSSEHLDAQLQGARALLVTVLVRGGDPTGLSSATATPRTDVSLKPQRPLGPNGSPHRPINKKSGQPTQQAAQQHKPQSLVERVCSRWRHFDTPTAMARYADESLWGRTVGILSSSSTVSEVDAEYFLLDFALFGEVYEAEVAASLPHAAESGDVAMPQLQYGAVGRPLEEAFREPFQRRAVLVALLLASARCVTLFGAQKPPHTTRTKDAMGSVVASVILILKLQDELVAELDDEDPVLQSLLDIAEWLSGTGNAEDKVLSRCVALFVTRELLPWELLSQSASVEAVEAVMDLFYRFDTWQVDPCFAELPTFMTVDGAAEAIMLVLDSFEDGEDEYPAVRRTARILNRTLAGYQEIATSLAIKKQRTIGIPRPPSTSVTGRKRVISANATRSLLSSHPSNAFIAAEESDRTLLCAEEEREFFESILNVHRRQFPPLHERHLVYVTQSTVELRPEDLLQHLIQDVEPRKRQALYKTWISELRALEIDMEFILTSPQDEHSHGDAGRHTALATLPRNASSESPALGALLQKNHADDEGDAALQDILLKSSETTAAPPTVTSTPYASGLRTSGSRSAGQTALELPSHSRATSYQDDETPYKIRAATSAAESASLTNARRQDAELREDHWARRRELEKEENREFLALLSGAQLEAMQLVDVPDEERAFFSRKTPSRPPTPVLDEVAQSAIALDQATLRPPKCFRIVDDEERLRTMIEDMCHTYWGVLLLEMKRSFLLKRKY
ncbi:Hypothetical protein, putative [Bodo saltans]|uniref:Uncharacterized protein n=1 Tax=Bodo saltans TaxID=75058 RepID=A0A0S4JM39_BODSA|nr:Hypothetical protein, putative [Bodo saltans]|eukprot:CUG92583.1 Hypothetical protein, putative [Bodo saltans]